MSQNIAHLKTSSVFYRLFPHGIPIKNIFLPDRAICEGSNGQPEDVYMVDLDKLTPEQFEELAAMVQAQCDPHASLEVAKKEIKSRGLPLRAWQVVSTSTDNRFFL